MRILVVAPHPDDEVLGCGGTIARYADAGHDITVAIVTKGWEPLFPDSQVEQVRAEARAASALLGVSDLRFLDLPVTALAHLPEHELNGALLKLFREVQPNWVLLPFRNDLHEDHRQIFDACMVASRPLAQRVDPSKVLCFETLSETHWHASSVEAAFTPNVYVDISEHLARKIDAMKCYESQARYAPHARSLESIEALARFRGMTVHCHAAEAFMLVREIL
jgi:LmbE family N-acetylglucosaminyl deacetylase